MFDEELDEMTRRIEDLEAIVFSSNPTEVEEFNEPSLWDTIAALESRLNHFEEVINPETSSALVPGAECLAWSIADGTWVEATIEDRPAPRTYTIVYKTLSGLKADGQRRQVCSQLILLLITVALTSICTCFIYFF